MSLTFFRRAACVALTAASLGASLGGCASINASLTETWSEKMPLWAGGIPADAPPRPGTAAYEKIYQEQQQNIALMKGARTFDTVEAANRKTLQQAQVPAPPPRQAVRRAPAPAAPGQPPVLASAARQLELENSIQASRSAPAQSTFPALPNWAAGPVLPAETQNAEQTSLTPLPRLAGLAPAAEPVEVAQTPNAEPVSPVVRALPAAPAFLAAAAAAQGQNNGQNTSMVGIY